jgi:hypothetical protein
MQVHQECRGTPHQVSAGATAGQLGQVRKIRQLSDNDLDRLVAVVVRQRADTGRRADTPGRLHVARPYVFRHVVRLAAHTLDLVYTNDRANLRT